MYKYVEQSFILISFVHFTNFNTYIVKEMSKLKVLMPEQKEFWKENGYIKISNIFTTKEINEILEAYDELFEQKRCENIEGLESAWAGSEMKKAAGNIDYTVSNTSYFCYFYFTRSGLLFGEVENGVPFNFEIRYQN